MEQWTNDPILTSIRRRHFMYDESFHQMYSIVLSIPCIVCWCLCDLCVVPSGSYAFVVANYINL